MRIRAGMDGLEAALNSELARVFTVVDGEVEAAAIGLKADLREETETMLGRRVALTWRDRFYPNKGDAKGPAGFVWSKAPRIISFFSAERVITPLGKYFAIPAAGVVGRRGRRATVAEVQQRFGRLKFIPFKDGNAGLFADPSRGRSAIRRGGRKAQLTLMFVLVRQLRSQQLIDLEATAQKWGAMVAAGIGRKLSS